MEKDKQEIEKLKKEYKIIKDNYNLPDFKTLNEDFHIEKVAEVETEILIREVRKFIADKMLNYMRFLENLLNPVNVPMYIFSIIKLLSVEEKKTISEIYQKLVKKEIQFIELDLEFNEEKEAEFIKNMFDRFNESRFDILKVIEKMGNGEGKKVEDKSRSYFG